MLGLPFHYRDERTDGAERVAGYEITGIQHMPINTVYQLLVDDRVGEADRIALVPDLLAYWLCGELANERTNASTTGLLDARTGEWSRELIEQLGLPAKPFRDLVEPGTLLGRALEIDAPVYTVASHDTASAYVAAPLRDEHSAILSSRHLVAAGPGARRPGLQRRRADQRARRRRHDPAAQERHGPVARAGVRARLGRRLPGAAAGRPRGDRPRPSSTSTTSASCAAATCPR